MATPAATSSALLVVLLLVAFTASAGAATFSITNRCPFPVWAAAMPVSGGGGAQLAPGETWTLTFTSGTGATGGRIWPRTGCFFDPATGRGGCQTGDCGGVLRCVLSGTPPATLAEFSLGNGGATGSYGISVVDGFTLPMDFSCSSAGDGGVIRCRDPGCPDGNHRPGEGKYRSCPAYSDYQVVFCP